MVLGNHVRMEIIEQDLYGELGLEASPAEECRKETGYGGNKMVTMMQPHKKNWEAGGGFPAHKVSHRHQMKEPRKTVSLCSFH